MSDLIDGVAAVLAGTALYASVRQMQADAKDRRISVRPALSFTNRIIRPTRSLVLSVKNTGLGPAEISAYSLLLDDAPVRIASDDDFRQFASRLGVVACDEPYAMSDITSGTVLAAGDEMMLLRLEEMRPLEDQLRLDAVFRRISAEISYRCLYGTSFKQKSSPSAY